MSQSQNQRRVRLSAASYAGDRRSRLALLGSALLHAAVIAATLFTWQHSLEIADESPPVVPVDLVTIADKTNIKAVAPKEEEKPKDETPLDEVKVSDAPKQTEMAAPEPPKEPPPKEAASEPVVEPAPAPVVPKHRPKPPPPKKKKAKFDVNNILALLNKQQPSAAKSHGKPGEQPRRGIGDQSAMTMDLVDALRNQMAQCWSPPVGAPNPQSLIVSYELFLNPDGSVARPPQLIGESQSGSPYIRAAEEAARRAIFTCAPYKLPADRYNQWRDITLVFDPRKMVGQ